MEMISLPVEIVASLDDSAKSQELRGLLQEIELMSDKITLTERSDNERKPSFSINRSGTDISVRFAGIPMGHEFTSLVLALLQVGGHRSEEHTSELQSLMRISYAVFCLTKKKNTNTLLSSNKN